MQKSFVVLDTNYILRFLLGDIKLQFEKAKLLFKSIEAGRKKGILSVLVVNELIWVLERFYKLERKDFIPLILRLVSIKGIKILEIKKSVLIAILRKVETSSLSFVDVYLVWQKEKLDCYLATFDKKMSKSS